MTTSKITVQRQGRYERFVLHIPTMIVSSCGLRGKYIEWSVGDNAHLTIFVHSQPGAGSTAVCANATASGVYHRVSVPKALVDALGLREASVEWRAVGPTVFELTVIRRTLSGMTEKKKEAKI